MNREVKGIIQTENPIEHWGFLPVHNETILDLGCGINNTEFAPTPVYFIQNGAHKVYGVDPSHQSYEWFKKNFNVKNFIPIMDYVDRTDKFEMYFGIVKPSVVKIDVEGSEVFMNAIKPEFLDGINHIGIEYHNLSCLISCENLLKENGFRLSYYKFPHLDLDHQGVLYADKNIIKGKLEL